MHFTQILVAMVFLLAILTLDRHSIYGAADRNNNEYPWMKKTSTHKTPYKISGDI
ncbi:uncharacterized protein LOC108041913 [Drosophila rhopaloa]|uniref:Uncharacterized protein LOC108041913 n=1 Tax=Drosophila rhopaloa TaxID=1041015 RepID=A0A6P4EG15_DRORH|nr:uncharacterized protein LOC108041913 [Drosophila rhopaloa]